MVIAIFYTRKVPHALLVILKAIRYVFLKFLALKTQQMIQVQGSFSFLVYIVCYSQKTGHLFGIELGASKARRLSNTIKISLHLSLENSHGTKWLRHMIPELAWIFPAISHSAAARFFMDVCGEKNLGWDTEIAQQWTGKKISEVLKQGKDVDLRERRV